MLRGFRGAECLCATVRLGVVGGLRLGRKMNMYVHIYPENDYLLEHSLIVFS